MRQKYKCILISVHKTLIFIHFITFTSRSSLKWENQKSAVGKEKLTGSSDKGLFRLLWLLSFHRYKLQYSLATVLFFDNVVALLLYIMTRKPTGFNTVNDLLHTQGVLINNFRVSRLNRLKDDSLLSFM